MLGAVGVVMVSVTGGDAYAWGPATHLYIVVEGEVDIRYRNDHGGYTTVDTLVKGSLMVWSALIEPHVTHSTAVARKDMRVIAIEAHKLRELMDEDPVLGSVLMSHAASAVSERLDGVRTQLACEPLVAAGYCGAG